jgi:hypothetical protein
LGQRQAAVRSSLQHGLPSSLVSSCMDQVKRMMCRWSVSKRAEIRTLSFQKIQSLSFQMSEARVLDIEGKLAGSFSSDSCNPDGRNVRKVGTLALGWLENLRGKCYILSKGPAFRDREKPFLVVSFLLHPQSLIALCWWFGSRRCCGWAPRKHSQQPSCGLST